MFGVFGETLKILLITYPIEEKIEYRKLKWMTFNILPALKQKSKLSKNDDANPSMINKGGIKLILEKLF